MKIYYNPQLKSHAKELRKKGVLSEVLLWNQLKGRKMGGYQFVRQKPIGDYIVDLFCSKLRLVIEIDGESHEGRFLYDTQRQKFLESIGLTVLRFNDADVKRELTNVFIAIEGWIENSFKQPPSSPFVKGELQSPAPSFLRRNNHFK
jgi:very-short-patch-repair endonuclease